MTGGQVVDITECSINFFRLLLLLVNGGKDVLSKLFTSRMTPNTTVDNFLQCYQRKLTELKNKRKILPSQWSLLFPVAKPDEWDISLWCLLLANICGISHPKDWNSQPAVADVSLEADLVRLRLFRNDICHAAEVKADSVTFQAVWKDVSIVLLRLTDHDPQYQKTFEKTIETYKEGPLPTSSHQKILLLELKQWQRKDGMEEINGIKSEISEIKYIVTQLDSEVFLPLLDTCNRIPEQIDRQMEKYDIKWNFKTTEIIKDLNQMIERYGSIFEGHMKNILVFECAVNARYTDVGMMERLEKLLTTALDNQKIMMTNQEHILQWQNTERLKTRRMYQEVMKTINRMENEIADMQEKRGKKTTLRAGGTDTARACGYWFENDCLEDYLQHLLYPSQTCCKKACGTGSWFSNLSGNRMTHRFDWNPLIRKYFPKAHIKECESGRSDCTRQDERAALSVGALTSVGERVSDKKRTTCGWASTR